MAEVVAIHGGAVPLEPDAGLVEELERLLDRARRGDLLAMAYATVNVCKVRGTGWQGASGTRDSLGAAILMLQHRYADVLLHPEIE